MRQKGAWIRIAEAVAAILIVSGVLLFVYSKSFEGPSKADYVYNLQKEILDVISSNESLRQAALTDNEGLLNSFVSTRIPSSFNSSVKVCLLGTGSNIGCNLNFQVDKSLYVEEIIVSTNLDTESFQPRRVRLFVWEK